MAETSIQQEHLLNVKGPGKRCVRAKKWLARYPHLVFSVGVIGLFSFVGLFAQVLAPFDPIAQQYGQQYLAPAWYAQPGVKSSAGNILGTDWAGRDVFSRLIYATQTAFFLCLLSIPPAGILGILLGLFAGYIRGWPDNLLMRFADIIQSFPAIMLVILVVLALRNTFFGELMNGLATLAVAFSLLSGVELARQARGAVLSLREQAFVEAAIGIGVFPLRIVFRHILPNCVNLVIVWLVSAVSKVIILEALLGYLGIGITPAVEGNEFIVTSWGGLFREGRLMIHGNPVMLLATAVCVILISVSFTFLGDYLRDRSEPRYRALI
jgi:ABC-type dipeptide/oligopeptide/nickel transport system permease subunit